MSVRQPTFDLQSHSRHSDGLLDADAVVGAAATAGVELLSLTDHDTVDGVREAAWAAEEIGIGLATGVEISALDSTGRDLHILGYVIEDRDPVLLERLASYREDRERRGAAMAQALRALGFELADEQLRKRAAAGKPIGRPHLAQAVTTHPANTERLAAEHIEESSAFLEAYLIPGAPAFRPRRRPSVSEAILAIHEAEGVAVWAHPFFDVDDPREALDTIDRFRVDGLDGVECFYVTHTEEQTALLAGRCAELSMLSTGSSDFHGPDHPFLSRFRAFSTYGLEPHLGPIDPSRP